jgi:hypothetical protein
MSIELSAAKDYVPVATNKVVECDSRTRVIAPGQNRLLSEFAAELVRPLVNSNRIFRRGETIVRVNQRKKTLTPVDPVEFGSWLETEGQIVCQRWAGKKLVDVTLPETSCRSVLAAPNLINGLRDVKRVNRVPLPAWRSEESWPEIGLLPEGYDEDEMTYTFRDVEYDVEMPIEKAKRVIEEWFRDVAWDPVDRARSFNAGLAMMLAAFCDQLLDDTAERPVFLVGANREGAGKTLLVKMAVAPVFGPVTVTPLPAPDKIQELLAAAVRAGRPYLFFDNTKGELEDASLEAFVTASRIGGRTLGLGSMFDEEKRCLVYMTTNSPKTGPDMRRRAIPINLFVQEARPENRKVSRALGERQILDGRAEILGALWSFVRFWSEKGKGDFYKGKQNCSFSDWGELIGGIVECVLGGPSPLDPPAICQDERLATFERFLSGLDETYTDTELRFAQLLDAARASGLFAFLADEEPTDKAEQKKEKSILSKRFLEHFSRSAGTRFELANGSAVFSSNGEEGRARRYTICRVASIPF